MSNKIDVTDFKIDDDLLYKSMKIKTHEKEALTPVKAVDLSKIKPKFEINRDENGLNEIHRIVYEKDQKYKSPEKKDVVRLPSIKSMNDDIDLQEKFQISLSNIKKKAREKDITMCFLEYQGDRYPNTDEIEFMVDISHQYSDLIPFPIISKTKEIENSSDFSSYLLFLNEYYEWLNKMNKKPMIAIVPKIGRSYLDELFDFYHGKDINAFYFDFEGRQPITIPPNIRKFFRKLTDENVFEKSFLHSTNIFPGRFRVSDTAINAKDILSFGLGFDCMGRNKKRPPPQKVIDNLPEYPERKFRLFNKNDYGYYQLKPENINELFPKDSKLDKNYFTDTNIPIYEIQNCFNIEQQGLEAKKLRKIIKEKPENYLKEKNYVSKDDISTLKKVHDFVMKSSSTETKIEKKSKTRSLFEF